MVIKKAKGVKKNIAKRKVKRIKKNVLGKKTGEQVINNQSTEQKTNEGYDNNSNIQGNLGSGEFGNTQNILDRGEVIYGDENTTGQQITQKEEGIGGEDSYEKNKIVDVNNSNGNEINSEEVKEEGNQITENTIENSNAVDIGMQNKQQERTFVPDDNAFKGMKEIESLPPMPKIILKNNKGVKSIGPGFSGKKFMTEKDIAMDFAIKVQKKFDRMIKASILFGSQTSAKDNAMAGSDIDIIFIIDDAAIDWDLELVSWYREELGKLVAAQSYGLELHINTVRLVTWWEDLMHGDPVVINILRYGEALIDSGGFFNPIKSLLLSGKIKSTPEAVYAALQRSPWHLARSKNASLGAIEGVYWSMIDAAHAALITAGKLPPSPEHVPEMLREVFVDSGMLKMNYVKSIREVYSLHKAISHGNVSSIKGQEIDEWQELAEKFLSEMTRIIDTMLESKK